MVVVAVTVALAVAVAVDSFICMTARFYSIAKAN